MCAQTGSQNVTSSRNEEIAYQEQLKQADARLHSGVAAVTDVDQAQAARDASVAQRLTDEGDLESAYTELTELTGQPHSRVDHLRGEFPISHAEPGDPNPWVAQAARSNFALQATVFAVQAADENASSKQAEYLPKVTGSLSYQEDNISGTQTLSPETPFLNPPGMESHTRMAMVKVTMPLYTSGMLSAQSKQAYAQYNTALQQKIETERHVIQETRKKLIAVNTDTERVSLNTPQAMKDATKKVVWKWEAEAHGRTAPNADPDGDGVQAKLDLRPPGQIADTETGFYCNMNRYYNPISGRYAQSNPVGLLGGLNTYGYVEGNPISKTDPLGLWVSSACDG